MKQNGNRQINNIIKSKQISFKVTRAWDCFTTCKVIFIMYIYILKCVSITNISVEHYMEGVVR